MEAERDTELQLLEELQACPASSMQAEAAKEKLDEHNRSRFPGFTIVGDNVDFKTHARYNYVYQVSAYLRTWFVTHPPPPKSIRASICSHKNSIFFLVILYELVYTTKQQGRTLTLFLQIQIFEFQVTLYRMVDTFPLHMYE